MVLAAAQLDLRVEAQLLRIILRGELRFRAELAQRLARQNRLLVKTRQAERQVRHLRAELLARELQLQLIRRVEEALVRLLVIKLQAQQTAVEPLQDHKVHLRRLHGLALLTVKPEPRAVLPVEERVEALLVAAKAVAPKALHLAEEELPREELADKCFQDCLFNGLFIISR